MGISYRKQLKLKLKQRPKLTTEHVKEVVYDEEERETYLAGMYRKKAKLRQKMILLEEEAKQEKKRQKRRGHKNKEKENADLAHQIMLAAQRKHHEEKTVGDSLVTIREL